jgi:hypothetical protein
LSRVNLDPPIAFSTTTGDSESLEVCVNFGILAGREATPAEIEELARALLAIIENVSIVSEQRYQVGRAHEATVHQVRVQIPHESMPDDPAVLEALAGQLVETAGRWAQACADERRADL